MPKSVLRIALQAARSVAMAAMAIIAIAVFARSMPVEAQTRVEPAPTRAADEALQFYPGTARTLPGGRIAMRVEAWVYERETRPALRSIIARYLGIDRDALSDEERARYDTRTQLFRFDSERGKHVQLTSDDGERRSLPRTGSDGRSRAEVILRAASLRDGLWLPFQGALAGTRTGREAVRAEGRALWVPDTGLSLVSDIDDTIKDSNVLVRRELLLNTFVRPFAAVDGMAARYRVFAESQRGFRVHYVSGSPHQLYPALADFLDAARFPPGSLHLRDVDLSRELFGSHGGTRAHKLAIVRRLIADFPQRRFVLIGDSGEQDPEIYAMLAREHPQQILAIWIRDVTGQTREDPRYAAAFAGIDTSRWHVFGDSGEIRLP
jgi:Uncharacterized conserved protein (DUF2183)